MVIGSLASHNLIKLHAFLRCGSQAHLSHPHGLPFIPPFLYRTSLKKPSLSTHKHRLCLSRNQGSPLPDDEGEAHNKTNEKKECNLQPVTTHVQKPSIPIWTRWVLGTMLSLILPLWQIKGELLTLEVEVDRVAETVQTVAEVVEKVAVVAEKVSSEMADKLPDDAKLKDVVLMVEHVSKEVVKDAQLTIDFIHKVDEIKQQVENLLEPLIEQQKLNITDN